jgi:hypothetical protein
MGINEGGCMKLLIQIFRFLFPKSGMEEDAREFMRIYARRERRKMFFEFMAHGAELSA